MNKNVSTIGALPKIFFVLLSSTLSVIFKDAWFLCGLFISILIMCVVCQINIIKIFKSAKLLIFAIFFVALVQTVFSPDKTPVVKIGDFVLISQHGLYMGTTFILRMFSIIFTVSILSTEQPSEISNALLFLKMPYEFVIMLIISFRYIPLFRQEFLERKQALIMRGIDFKTLKVLKRIKLYAYLISPSVAGSILRSASLSMALEARAFRLNKYRTSIAENPLNISNIIFMILNLLMFAVSIIFYFFIT